ncbi:2-succinyl-6-hydroxy-2,4-cyclohexadiene-1-carboxylate synthase [Peribacillus cavernae]|uniref:Putative 2-succinyl-6-hydroxy-2,4-cyclohexadiene-1-carboxylate synthase n=1 Tax=Peribacillus cavernae TaxID=1674310 RepID=A0A433HUB9_9BACI|nr:2-succinyl-6-hydroxy-2,4-cyclohexadiene-1-carboxylate synthase [Peribacillus cavernae]MDQ0220257.1 2-succinyl-6-hydroxy-2,4-cyclohexadiene-1-carboxylate synthase [Peribacillus cavernae]RUQ31922.1 2-succinyl-6-hydroxy-2,4-cyclohexadiene-1-carboxylate synthase [Peribacillus cavernae]
MKIVSKDVAYHVEIRGEGEPLLLLHGFTGSLETWHFLVPILGSRYKLILVDIIGHGNTDSPIDYRRYEMEKAAGDLQHILHTLEMEKVHILGYSMGGRLALSFACLYPQYVNKLILESASPGLLTEEERQIRQKIDKELAERIICDGLAEFIDYWENIPLFATQKNLPGEKKMNIKRQRLWNSETGLANSLIGMGTGSQPSWWESLQNIDLPVLLVTGEFDEKFCRIAENMQKLMKHGDWKIIKGTGHAIHVEVDEKFGKIISEFLSH